MFLGTDSSKEAVELFKLLCFSHRIHNTVLLYLPLETSCPLHVSMLALTAMVMLADLYSSPITEPVNLQ